MNKDKVLDLDNIIGLIVFKQVNWWFIEKCKTHREYNSYYNCKQRRLTKREFEDLKEVEERWKF